MVGRVSGKKLRSRGGTLSLLSRSADVAAFAARVSTGSGELGRWPDSCKGTRTQN